jgi:hypothetical protein
MHDGGHAIGDTTVLPGSDGAALVPSPGVGIGGLIYQAER